MGVYQGCKENVNEKGVFRNTEVVQGVTGRQTPQKGFLPRREAGIRESA